MEAYLLLGIPILVAITLTLFCFTVIGYFITQHWNRQHHEAYEELDDVQREEIVQSYMTLLQPYVFDHDTAKYNDCSICLKEFE